MHTLRPLPVLLLLVVSTLWYSCRQDRETTMVPEVRPRQLPQMERVFNTYQSLHSSGDYAALADTLRKANSDLQASELYVQAAYVYWEGEQPDSTALMLERAIDRGMSNPNILDKLPGGKAFPDTPVWKSLRQRLDSIQDELQRLENFGLETRAMDAFWPYLNRALEDSAKAREHLRDFVFEGPPEIRDYYVVRYGSIDQMYGQMVNSAPRYYRYLQARFHTDSLQPLKKDILAALSHFKEIYPKAVFPKVYVVPGILNSGGTATEMGMFLGGDMYGRGPGMPLEDLTPWQEGAIMSFEELPRLTVHELMHFQQNYRDRLNQETLLAAVIHEGVCDFLTELCFGEPLQNENLDFLADPSNEAWIFSEFQEELLSWQTDKWLYNGGSIEDRPHDLGYTIGYLITKSYYKRQPDKAQAVHELLNTSDFREIVLGSDYAYLLSESPGAP